MGDLIIRAAQDGDSDGLITLIGTVFAEYPDCVLDVDGEMPELRTPATALREIDGRWWIAELDGKVVGSVSISPVDGRTIELKRLYVAATARRRGIGAHLVRLAESEAANRDAQNVFLWTDTRFADAHRLYERLGYARSPGTRALHDVSNTIECRYVKELSR